MGQDLSACVSIPKGVGVTEGQSCRLTGHLSWWLVCGGEMPVLNPHDDDGLAVRRHCLVLPTEPQILDPRSGHQSRTAMVALTQG